MRRRTKMMVFLFLLMSVMLTAGSISGTVAVTGPEQVLCDLFLIHHPFPNQIEDIIHVMSGEVYSFTDVEVGSYIVQVIPQSLYYLPEYYPGVPSSGEAEQIILNNNNDEITGIDFLLLYQEEGISCVISGHVLLPDGEPAVGLGVYLYGVFNIYWNNYMVETDSTGAFSFDEVYPASYVLFLEHLAGYQHYFWENGHSYQQADIIHIEPGAALTGLILQMEPAPIRTVSGTVREMEGEDVFPVAGALVSGYALNCWGEGEYFQDITDEYGHYQGEVSAGMYWLFCTKDGYLDQYWEGVPSFDEATPLHINEDLADIDFLLTSVEDPENNTISGYISVDGEEPGFPCLVIVIASDEDDDWSETTLSESSGYYYIEEIPAGDYYVVMMTSTTPPVYYPEGYDWENAEIVYIEGNVTGINFELENMTQNGVFQMEGMVTDVARNPVVGASVVFFDENGMPVSYGISNADGEYSAVSLGTGMYSVLAGKTYYESASETISLTEGSSLDFVITQAVTTEEQEILPKVNPELYCYPNPFLVSGQRSGIKIQLYPQEAGAGRVSVYNLRGQLVENIFTGWLDAEPMILNWDSVNGRNDISTGVYLISLEQFGEVKSAQKLLLIK